ncbi:MAG: hypothetical protein LBR39_04295, partial [Coriobacteriales bacterium]|nr:hypothetical protein [Coriobacteriales bacterium]
ILSNTPNPLNLASDWPAVPVQVEVSAAPEVDLQDECVQHCPQNYRAFQNTWDYHNLFGR